MSDNNTWCVYPFIHVATFTNGAITPCCIAKEYPELNLNNITIKDAWNHPAVQEVRRKMLAGEKVSNCQDCYNAEAHGVDSHRTSSNRVYADSYGITKESFTSPEVGIENLVTLDLRLGNTCNLKCIMCRPNESHQWYEDILKLKEETLSNVIASDVGYKVNYNRNDYNWINNQLFWDNIDEILPNIKEFIFGGGEPFMLKEVKTLLKKAVEMDVAKNLSIRFHTNGTYLIERDFELLQHFRKIQLMFSIDGVDQMNYFLRYPANWNKILKTINENEKYQPNIESMILCSLSSISAYYLDELYDYVSEHDWKKLPVENIRLGRVHHPIYLNPQTLDVRRKEIVENKWKNLIKKYPSVSQMLEENLNWIKGENTESTVNDTILYVDKLLKIRPDNDPLILKDFLNAN